ncbi:hypothetical protein SCP_0102950 [Sparassis crispa]|uniref:Uncharacterized protein n=1 Tax=Sparassis crispa TaxID=139825 RepID=A0A401G5I0_9APHY|nr:hypothetical protein SCP_0102950 [Sparassis crispa]GBE77421.1 hypothetical protein SCP_0102950 [Sparassis crispa]
MVEPKLKCNTRKCTATTEETGEPSKAKKPHGLNKLFEEVVKATFEETTKLAEYIARLELLNMHMKCDADRATMDKLQAQRALLKAETANMQADAARFQAETARLQAEKAFQGPVNYIMSLLTATGPLPYQWPGILGTKQQRGALPPRSCRTY